MPWFSINTKLFQAQIWFEKWYIRVEILHLGSSFWTGHSIVEIFWSQLIKISLGRRGGLKGGSAESESNWTLDIVCYCNQEIFCRGHTHSWLAQYSTVPANSELYYFIFAQIMKQTSSSFNSRRSKHLYLKFLNNLSWISG